VTSTAGYDIHGVNLLAEAAEPTPLHALDRRLGPFRSEARLDEGHVRLLLGVDTLSPPSGNSRPVYDAPDTQVAYCQDIDELYVDYRGVRLRCAPGPGLIQMSWPRGDTADVWVATHPLLTIALIEVLKRRGLYSLHAACAATAGDGVVVAGPSGAGKSTLAIALARAGWRFLSDDMVFLARGPAGGDVLGFPDEVDVTPQTLAMFPELVTAARPPEVPGRNKSSLRLEDALDLTPLPRCRPTVVVLPSLAHRSRTTLVPVGAAEALVELAPNVLLTERVSAQAHLTALADLVEHTPCYRLETGRDLDEVIQMLAGVVAEASGSREQTGCPPSEPS